MAKPLPEKLNPGWQAAVRHMLATPPHPKKAVKKKGNQRSIKKVGK
jgi:hypothetical protein